MANAKENFIKIESLVTFSNLIWKILLFDYHYEERIIFSCKMSSIMKILRPIFFIIIVIDLVFYTLINASYIFELAVTIDFDFKKFTGAFMLISSASMLLVKYSCIYFNKDAIQEILKFFPKEYNKTQLKEYKIDKFLTKYQKFVTFYRYFHLKFPLIFFIILFVMGTIKAGHKIYPFEIKFPFDAFRNDVYPFLLLLVLISHGIYTITFTFVENLTFGLTTIVATEFKILAEKYRRIKENPENIISCIKRQNELYDIVENIQNIFSISFFTNFLLSSLTVCLAAFTCSISPDIIVLIFNAVLSLVSMMQIFIQCFFGQILYDAGIDVLNGINECGWENMKDVKLKKLIMIIIIRSQKPAVFLLLRTWKITLEQFQSVSLNVNEVKLLNEISFVDFEVNLLIFHFMPMVLYP
ncbi:hypothetical protein PVAND_015653 [Polypedilum vanderplanki]|uniref:Odorant receptor n=1 Tax=Polypedilum vanderplanki TaxID=319348 RepID=A0A9J6BCS8_POLVA|nr:hypothetical protein PVAND_015653 [Polypedilum vanderplanki]